MSVSADQLSFGILHFVEGQGVVPANTKGMLHLTWKCLDSRAFLQNTHDCKILMKSHVSACKQFIVKSFTSNLI